MGFRIYERGESCVWGRGEHDYGDAGRMKVGFGQAVGWGALFFTLIVTNLWLSEDMGGAYLVAEGGGGRHDFGKTGRKEVCLGSFFLLIFYQNC